MKLEKSSQQMDIKSRNKNFQWRKYLDIKGYHLNSEFCDAAGFV